ncbi:hypothetical protein ACFVWR_10245 [Leifsonia sp. NPDC058292]|uniref:hypothetical protein n=1 Tax=Leifsonia sp. NPDC058292 TaxID=3346428 RepID=UPI0036DD4C4E
MDQRSGPIVDDRAAASVPAVASGGAGALPTIWEWLARPMRYRAVRRFRIAAESGDAEQLAALLDPAVAVVVDDSEATDGAVRVVGGLADSVALLLHAMTARPGLAIVERSVNSQAGLMLSHDDRVTASMTTDFTGGLISLIWVRLHPDELRHWNRV